MEVSFSIIIVPFVILPFHFTTTTLSGGERILAFYDISFFHLQVNKHIPVSSSTLIIAAHLSIWFIFLHIDLQFLIFGDNLSRRKSMCTLQEIFPLIIFFKICLIRHKTQKLCRVCYLSTQYTKYEIRRLRGTTLTDLSSSINSYL